MAKSEISNGGIGSIQSISSLRGKTQTIAERVESTDKDKMTMATPVGHYFLGLSITQVFARDDAERKECLWLVTIACLPDLDVVPGLFVGNLVQFHHGASHIFTSWALGPRESPWLVDLLVSLTPVFPGNLKSLL